MSEDVTADGLVKKTVVTQGVGEAPPLHARCLGALAHALHPLAD